MQLDQYYGRRVLVPAVDVDSNRPAKVKLLKTIEVETSTIHCLRCNSRTAKGEAALPNGQYYCPKCINLGRVSTLDRFYHVPEANQFRLAKQILSWQGKLSPFQKQASSEIRKGLANHDKQLLWAVTGAGKTEMMFNGIADCLKRGERLAIASPRVDVCLELYQRLKEAFDQVPIALLHGRSEEPYQYRQLTICTTHQLLRFYHAFDNLIVDEVDAFPYAMNPRLLYATSQAVKSNGGTLFLTATPGKELQQQIRQKKIKVSYLPLRYHGHLLPVIHVKLVPNWRKQLAKGQLPKSLKLAIIKCCNRNQRFLLFVPHVADLPIIGRALIKLVSADRFALVHASDPQRLEKVTKMRKKLLQFLVTTTILERGVTFPGIDVFVLGADDPVFSTAALVQIAGRAGSSPQRPDGFVAFWCSAIDKRVREAMSQINQLNRRGARLKRCSDTKEDRS